MYYVFLLQIYPVTDDPDDPETIDEVDPSENSEQYDIYIRAGVIIEPGFCAICRIKFPGTHDHALTTFLSFIFFF